MTLFNRLSTLARDLLKCSRLRLLAISYSFHVDIVGFGQYEVRYITKLSLCQSSVITWDEFTVEVGTSLREDTLLEHAILAGCTRSKDVSYSKS